MNYREIQELTATAQHFNDYKVYTKEPTGSKAWFNFWKQEKERCINGVHIGSDYITGYNYHFLNYTPILKTEVV